MDSVVVLNGEFINLYSQDNPILEDNDLCYCMITNNTDYHRPIIIKALVVVDKFCDGLNKQYFVRIMEILESPKTIQNFFLGCPFDIYPWYDSEIHSKKTIQINASFDYNNNLFKVEAFFTRNTEKKILELRENYIKIIRADITKMLDDIESINY